MTSTSVVTAVVELWRYPVKSMTGERIDRAQLTPRIAGDREWGVFDAATGKLLSAKSVGALLAARARFDDATGDTAIDLPTGATLVAGTDAADATLSGWLARAVVLRRPSADAVSTIDTELLDGGMQTFTTQPGMLFDSRSFLHLVSTTALRGARRPARRSERQGAVRRYRPNILIEAADEDAWVGRDVTLGTAIIAHCRKQTERCVIVTRAQPDGIAADRELLRMLVAKHGSLTSACTSIRIRPASSPSAIASGCSAAPRPVRSGVGSVLARQTIENLCGRRDSNGGPGQLTLVSSSALARQPVNWPRSLFVAKRGARAVALLAVAGRACEAW